MKYLFLFGHYLLKKLGHFFNVFAEVFAEIEMNLKKQIKRLDAEPLSGNVEPLSADADVSVPGEEGVDDFPLSSLVQKFLLPCQYMANNLLANNFLPNNFLPLDRLLNKLLANNLLANNFLPLGRLLAMSAVFVSLKKQTLQLTVAYTYSAGLASRAGRPRMSCRRAALCVGIFFRCLCSDFSLKIPFFSRKAFVGWLKQTTGLACVLLSGTAILMFHVFFNF